MKNTEALGDEIASLVAHLDAATHRLLALIREFDEAKGWHDQGAMSCAHWLAWRVGMDTGTAREKVRVANALSKLPAIDEALRSARLSYAKVRAITRVATPQNEALLLDMALKATGAQLERLCRGYRSVQAAHGGLGPEERSVHRRLMSDGMVKIELVLAPDEADLIMRAIDRAREVHAETAAAESAGHAAAAPVAVAPATAASVAAAPSPPRSPQEVSAETSWPTRADGRSRWPSPSWPGTR